MLPGEPLLVWPLPLIVPLVEPLVGVPWTLLGPVPMALSPRMELSVPSVDPLAGELVVPPWD